MMVPVDTSYSETQHDDATEGQSFDFVEWLKSRTRKQYLGGLLTVAALFTYFSGGEGAAPKIAGIGGFTGINKTVVENAENHERANYQLRSQQYKSGLWNDEAQRFLGTAVQFRNQQGHYCSTRSVKECLISFLKNKRQELLALETDDSGVVNTNREKASVLFQIESIEIAIASVSNSDPATQAFLSTVVPFPEIKAPPGAIFIDALGQHIKKQQLFEQIEDEMVETQIADQGLNDCRLRAGEACF